MTKSQIDGVMSNEAEHGVEQDTVMPLIIRIEHDAYECEQDDRFHDNNLAMDASRSEELINICIPLNSFSFVTLNNLVD